ncbi:MAG: biotin-dependent carboxyltransferase family protein [Rubellimicrobium sp.]|nr:biotin-dependent carboxyltransferase family protein [Rubellimicrobium sp.]
MALLVVLNAGPRLIVVDRGFRGARGQGVPPCGALDLRALALVNGILGNEAGTAALEWGLVPPRLRAQGGAVRLALGGGDGGQVTGTAGDARRIAPWQAFTLHEGETLVAEGAGGLIGIGGGPDLAPVLHSRTTMLRAGFGGFHGRALTGGDRIACAGLPLPVPGQPDLILTPPPVPVGPIRLVAGPQDDAFAPEAFDLLTSALWVVSPRADRMGLRLEGPGLPFAEGRGPDIVSDGIVPGAVQVPGTGRPIVLLADAQTTGGYAKIACVIRADLWRLAALRPGDRLRFELVTVRAAESAARAEAAAVARAIAGARPVGGVSATALQAGNLAGAAVDAARPDHFPGHVEGGSPCG